MKVDRSKLVRGLNLVTIAGINQIVVGKDGRVCFNSPDGSVVVYGNVGITDLGFDVALPDISLFVRMIKRFSAPEIDVKYDQNCFQMSADRIQWKYLAGAAEIFQTLDPNAIAAMIQSVQFMCQVPVDLLKKISGIQATVKAAYIHFYAQGGQLNVVVGDVGTYSGTTQIDVHAPTDFDIKLPADRFIEIVDRVDRPHVTLGFGVSPDRAFLQVQIEDFSWILASVTVEEA